MGSWTVSTVTTDLCPVARAELYFGLRGAGPLVFTVSGLGGDAGCFTQAADILADEFTVLSYDRRGNSRSTGRTSEAMSIEQQSQDAATLLEYVDHGSALVFGSSAGANIALDLAAHHSDAVKGVIAHEPPIVGVLPDAAHWRRFFDQIYATSQTKGIAQAAAEFAASVVGAQQFPRPADVEARMPGNWRFFFDTELRSIVSYVPDLVAITRGGVHVVLVHSVGSGDAYCARAAAELAHELGCELVELPGYHMVYMDQPGRVLRNRTTAAASDPVNGAGRLNVPRTRRQEQTRMQPAGVNAAPQKKTAAPERGRQGQSKTGPVAGRGAKRAIESRAMQGRVAFVTGGASGIGRAICGALVSAGASVVVADINGSAAATLARELGDRGPGSATALSLDVADARSFEEAVGAAHAKEGRLDLLFNNAGIGIGGPMEELAQAHWERTLDVNLRGVVHGVRAAYPRMVEQGFGHIVNTASLGGLIPFPLGVPYATTKYAVVGLSLSLRIEAQTHGVRISVVCPGVIDTPILDAEGPPDLPRTRLAGRGREMFIHSNRGPAYPPERFAEDVLRGVERNRAIILAPALARRAWIMNRIVPRLMERVLARDLEWTRRHLLASPKP